MYELRSINKKTVGSLVFTNLSAVFCLTVLRALSICIRGRLLNSGPALHSSGPGVAFHLIQDFYIKPLVLPSPGLGGLSEHDSPTSLSCCRCSYFLSRSPRFRGDPHSLSHHHYSLKRYHHLCRVVPLSSQDFMRWQRSCTHESVVIHAHIRFHRNNSKEFTIMRRFVLRRICGSYSS